jgi:2-oxo-4-hydroxy-4-carboxy-5-ureidoimidazoline decarboxylase
MLTIDQFNAIEQKAFTELLGGIFEDSPWVAEKAWESKPFTSFLQLHKEMAQVVKSASKSQQLALIQNHPNLGDRVQMSEESVNEQKGAGLTDLTPLEYANFIRMNQQYMDTFGFPFILAVRGKNKHDIYKAMEDRVHNDQKSEFETALQEIYKIALLRIEEKFMSKVQETS